MSKRRSKHPPPRPPDTGEPAARPLPPFLAWVDRRARALEEQPISTPRYLIAFAAIVLARHILEILVAQDPVFTPLQFFVHYPLAYVAPMLGLVLVLHVFSGVPVLRITKLMLYVWALTLLPPLADLLLGRSGEAIGYLKPAFEAPGTILLRFFDPTAQFAGTTAGIRIEAAIACALGALYVWIRTPARMPSLQRVLRSVGATAGVYLAALSFFALPRLFEAVAAIALPEPVTETFYAPPTFTRTADVTDRIRVLCLVPLCLTLGAVWAARTGRVSLGRAMAAIPIVGAAVAVVLTSAGIFLGAFAQAELQGVMPPPAPLDLMSAVGLVAGAILVTWAAALASRRPAENNDQFIALGFASAALSLAFSADSVAARLLITAFGLLLVGAALPENLRRFVSVPAEGLSGLAFLGVGTAWASGVDALVVIPPVTVLFVLLGGGIIAGTGLIANGAPARARIPSGAWRTIGVAVLMVLAATLWLQLTSPDQRTSLLRSTLTRPKLALRQAGILDEAGQIPEAIALYEHVLQQHPVRASVHARVGELLWSSGADTARAELRLREAVRLDPGQVPARQILGLLLLDDGRVEEGTRWLGEAARLAPRHPVVLRSYGEALARFPSRAAEEAGIWRRYLDASADWPQEATYRDRVRARLREIEAGR